MLSLDPQFPPPPPPIEYFAQGRVVPELQPLPRGSCDPRKQHSGKSTDTKVWRSRKEDALLRVVRRPRPSPGPRPGRPLYLQPTPHPKRPAHPRGGAAGAAAAPASTGRRRRRLLLGGGSAGLCPAPPPAPAPRPPRAGGSWAPRGDVGRGEGGGRRETLRPPDAVARATERHSRPASAQEPCADTQPGLQPRQLCPETTRDSGLLLCSVPSGLSCYSLLASPSYSLATRTPQAVLEVVPQTIFPDSSQAAPIPVALLPKGQAQPWRCPSGLRLVSDPFSTPSVNPL